MYDASLLPCAPAAVCCKLALGAMEGVPKSTTNARAPKDLRNEGSQGAEAAGGRPAPGVRTESAHSQPTEAESDGFVMPSVARMRATAKPQARRGKRSALYSEFLAEDRQRYGRAPTPKMTRAEALQRARAAKAAKKARVSDPCSSSSSIAAAALSQAAGACVAGTTASQAVLQSIHHGPHSTFGSYPMAELLSRAQLESKTSVVFEQLVDYVCRLPTATAMSSTVLADRVGISEKALPTTFAKLGSACINCDHSFFRDLVACLTHSELEPIMFVETSSYDETPMETRSQEVALQFVDQRLATNNKGSEAEGAVIPRVRKQVVATSVGPTKLFQARSGIYMLMQAKAKADSERPEFYLFSGHPLTWVQALESCTGEILQKALEDLSCVPAASGAFRLQVRASTKDRLAANNKAERGLSAARGEKWLSLASDCDAHSIFGSQSKSMELLSDCISKMVHLSLSLRMSNQMARFRACLEGVVRKRIKIISGTPPPSAVAYRDFVLGLFLSRGSFAAKRRALLVMWCNGDWRNTEAIEHYASPGRLAEASSPESITKHVSLAIVSALACKQPATFPRHRWTGCDLATDEVGLLLAVHGVLLDAYVAFLIACGMKAARRFGPRRAADM